MTSRPRASAAATTVADAVEVLLERASERDADVVVPGLGDEADRVGIGVEQRRDAGVVRGRAAGALRHAEGGEACAFLVRFSAKKLVSSGFAPG